MKSLILILLLGAVAFYIVPSMNAGSPCTTLAYKYKNLNDDDPSPDNSPLGRVFSHALVGVIGSSLMRVAMQRRYPGVPPEVSCAALWWVSLANPAVLTRLPR